MIYLNVNRSVIFSFLLAIVLLLHSNVWSQILTDRTVGLITKDTLAFEGYTLFAPNSSITTYLIDNDGLLVHSWESDYRPGQSVYLLENGNLLRTANVHNSIFYAGGSGGRVQILNWDGEVIWDYLHSGSEYCQHHDVEILPNGNVLLIAWEFKSFDEAIQSGRNSNLISENSLWPDYIIEVEPNGINDGAVIWEWHVWDHLIQNYDSSKLNYGVVSDHPELVDLNFVLNTNTANADWNHTNSVNYNEELNQIILSVHNFNEIWIIDHSTTTAEAASHEGGNSGKGGDLLYRWGNPRTYDTGILSDTKLYGQHDAQWIDSGYPGEGNILIFNNGTGRNYSTVDEIIPPLDEIGNYIITSGMAYGPDEQTWIYESENSTDFYSQNISGAQRLSNGNTLVCSGETGNFFEVTANQEIVWYYINPVTDLGILTQGDSPVGTRNSVFKIRRYAPEYAGLEEHDLTPGEPIEKYETVAVESSNLPNEFKLNQNYPNPFNPSTTISFELPSSSWVSLTIYNVNGEKVASLVDKQLTVGDYQFRWSAQNLPSGIYCYRLIAGLYNETKQMVLLK